MKTADSNPQSPSKEPGSLRRRLKRGALVLGTLALVMTLALIWAITRVPAFYRQATGGNLQQWERDGDEFERKALQLRNDIKSEGDWQATIQQSEFNGWLQTDVPQKYPTLLPSAIQNPRVGIQADVVQAGFGYRFAGLTIIVSLKVSVFMTERPNEVGIRLRKLRAGALPLPLTYVMDRLTSAAQQLDMDLRWTVEGGDPVGLITVDPLKDETSVQFLLRALEVRDGEVHVSGKTGRSSSFLDFLKDNHQSPLGF